MAFSLFARGKANNTLYSSLIFDGRSLGNIQTGSCKDKQVNKKSGSWV